MDKEAVENIRLQNVLSGDWMEMPIEELGLHRAMIFYLKRAEINVIGDLVRRTEKEMLNLEHISPWVLNEIKSKLAQMGLSFRVDSETSEDEELEIDLWEKEEMIGMLF